MAIISQIIRFSFNFAAHLRILFSFRFPLSNCDYPVFTCEARKIIEELINSQNTYV